MAMITTRAVTRLGGGGEQGVGGVGVVAPEQSAKQCVKEPSTDVGVLVVLGARERQIQHRQRPFWWSLGSTAAGPVFRHRKPGQLSPVESASYEAFLARCLSWLATVTSSGFGGSP